MKQTFLGREIRLPDAVPEVFQVVRYGEERRTCRHLVTPGRANRRSSAWVRPAEPGADATQTSIQKARRIGHDHRCARQTTENVRGKNEDVRCLIVEGECPRRG